MTQEQIDIAPSMAESRARASLDALIGQRDRLIKQAVSYVLGSTWTMEDYRDRVQIQQYPDGKEIVVVDGIWIMELTPLQVENNGSYVTFSFKHRWLSQIQ